MRSTTVVDVAGAHRPVAPARKSSIRDWYSERCQCRARQQAPDLLTWGRGFRVETLKTSGLSTKQVRPPGLIPREKYTVAMLFSRMDDLLVQ